MLISPSSPPIFVVRNLRHLLNDKYGNISLLHSQLQIYNHVYIYKYLHLDDEAI